MEFSDDLSVYNLLMRERFWIVIWTIAVIFWVVVVTKKYAVRDVFFWGNLMMLIMLGVVIVISGLLHYAANETKTVLDTVRLIIVIGTPSTSIGVLSYVNWKDRFGNKRRYYDD